MGLWIHSSPRARLNVERNVRSFASACSGCPDQTFAHRQLWGKVQVHKELFPVKLKMKTCLDFLRVSERIVARPLDHRKKVRPALSAPLPRTVD